MSAVILTTVGTSLLNNSQRINLTLDQEILDYLRQDPKKASAESNSLSRIWQAGDGIVLLHSATPEGRKAADLLRQYWEQKGAPCEKVEIDGLAYEAQGFVDYGLKQFVQTLAGEIRKARRKGKEVIINATGGFKAEIAYATALGLIFKVPVYYIHEKFQEVVKLPPSPFGWDSEILQQNEDFFTWIDAELRPRAEVESRVKSLVYQQEVRLLLENTPDGYTVLSPLGQAYLEAFRYELDQAKNVPIYFSKKARHTWDNFDPSTKKNYRRLLDRLRLPNRASHSELKSGGGDALAYPKGHVDERVFYAEKDGKLYVFALTRHGPEYDKMCQEGFCWGDYPQQEFTLWED